MRFTKEEASLIARVMRRQGYLTYTQKESSEPEDREWAVVLYGVEEE